jgi:PAS domain S-box-containing protein
MAIRAPTSRPLVRRRALTLAIVVAYLGIAAAVAEFARPQLRAELGPLPVAFAIYGAVMGPAMFLAALVLTLRARTVRSMRASLLAAAHVFSAPLVVIGMITVDGIGLPAALENPQLSVWTYALWHLGWFSLIAAYAWVPSRQMVRAEPVVAGAGLAAVVALLFGLGGHASLPLVHAGTWLSSAYIVAAVSNAVIIAALVGLAVRPARERSPLDVWLLAALALVAVATMLTWAGGNRFSLGAYLGRGTGALVALVVLFAVGSDYIRALRRAIAAQRLGDVSEALPAVVLLLDRSAECTYVNGNWERLTGQARPDALGGGYRAMVFPPDADALVGAAQSDPQRGPSALELRLRTRSGEWRWHQLSITPMAHRDGTGDAWLGVAMDIEERIRATSALEESLDTARHVATTLQEAFLPSALPTIEGVALQATYRPATSLSPIGGDWYDVFQLADGRYAVAIGDVGGHGLAASAQMVRLRETLRGAAALEAAAPDRILARVNATAGIGQTLASVLFGILDPAELTFTYSGAGHPPPFLLRDGEAIALDSDGVLLGVENESAYAVRTQPLAAGDRLVLYTDGLIEATGDVVAGEFRLRSALVRGTVDPDALVETVAGPVLRDDVAVLVLSLSDVAAARASGAPWRFLSDDALIAAPSRASFTAYLRNRGVDNERIAEAEVVFGELVGNVVRHAPGPIEIELYWAEVPSLIVRDRGPGFELRETVPDLYAEGGRGLFLMRYLGAELSVLPRVGGGSEAVAKLPALLRRTAVGAPDR